LLKVRMVVHFSRGSMLNSPLCFRDSHD
jgi:hypothetical protein